MKVSELFNVNQGLTELLDKELPTATSYKIQVNHQKVANELKVPQEMMNKLVQKYKLKDNEDGSIQIKDNSIEKFNKESQELMEQEVDISLKPIKLSELQDISVKGRTLALLGELLEVDETAEK